MFIEDIRNDFYNVLLGNRVLLLVHYDVDAICTCKILQELFKCDNIPYTLIPIGTIPELKSAYEENSEEVKYVVLVNCGGALDVVDLLQPEEDVVFFILDSHKPTDVCNVYSDGQVRLVYKDVEENIPNFDDIFRDDEDEEEEPTESGVEGLEALATRRRERREWEENRHTLMFNYTQFSYYGKPSGIVALELAWRLSRVSTEVLWCASVAAAAAEETYARDGPRCLLDAESLHRHIAIAAGATADKDHAAKIVLEEDIRLPLYRLCSLWESLSLAGAVAPRLHTHRGPQLLRRLLADLGIPIQQARQAYRSMDVSYRRTLVPSLSRVCAELRLDAARTAFLLTRPHAHAAAAHDLPYVLMALPSISLCEMSSHIITHPFNVGVVPSRQWLPLSCLRGALRLDAARTAFLLTRPYAHAAAAHDLPYVLMALPSVSCTCSGAWGQVAAGGCSSV
ncbi:hypothetical protein JYU34_011728 [Plutella xylostella]|uniref:Cell division control protein 45 n=1 Tax=Plutella xylostella TaxID=51655 RepID=A0ABQ7QDE4_PLUXY|nr:hypothetical protein JYU34_011728 [Plutella xylostella]